MMSNTCCFLGHSTIQETAPTNRKSGTKIALDYAIKQAKKIVRVL